MHNFLSRIDPICKIIFIFAQLIFIYTINNIYLTVSVLILFLLLNFYSLERIKSSLNKLLNISPLLLSLFLLGYLFGNNLHKDINLIFNIMLLVIYTFLFLETTNSYDFLASMCRIIPAGNSFILIFSYNLIYFFPNLQRTIKNSVSNYKHQYGALKNIKNIAIIFTAILEKTIIRANNHSVDKTFLINNLKSGKFKGLDLLPVLIICIQLSVIII